jgi:hypothetical protein
MLGACGCAVPALTHGPKGPGNDGGGGGGGRPSLPAHYVEHRARHRCFQWKQPRAAITTMDHAECEQEASHSRDLMVYQRLNKPSRPKGGRPKGRGRIFFVSSRTASASSKRVGENGTGLLDATIRNTRIFCRSLLPAADLPYAAAISPRRGRNDAWGQHPRPDLIVQGHGVRAGPWPGATLSTPPPCPETGPRLAHALPRPWWRAVGRDHGVEIDLKRLQNLPAQKAGRRYVTHSAHFVTDPRVGPDRLATVPEAPRDKPV